MVDPTHDDPQKMGCAGSGSDWWIQRIIPWGCLIRSWLMGLKDDERMLDLVLVDETRRWPSESVGAGSGENKGENAKSSRLGSNPESWASDFLLLTNYAGYWFINTIKTNNIYQNNKFLARINAPEFKPASKVMTHYHLLPWIFRLKLWTFTYGHGVVAITLCNSETAYK